MTKRYDIIYLDKTDSTNSHARRHIDSLDNLSVVTATEQTSGRGQGTHIWHSEAGLNLLASIVLKKEVLSIIPASGQSLISLAAAQSVKKLLDRYGIQAWIKPPNDIYVEDRKICGILIEHSLRGSAISWSIVGIGLNVNQSIFPPELPNPTSMTLECRGRHFNIDDILEELIDIFRSSLTLSLLQDPQP